MVRHGETEWSRTKRHTGRTDVPLTEDGRREAAALGPLAASRPWARVLTSPLSRARDTCALAGLGDRAEERVELLEWDYGDYEGITSADVRRERPGWTVWTDGCPRGEDVEDVARRADGLLASLRGADGDTIVFAHGHVGRVLTARWLELDPVEGRRFLLGTGHYGVLGHERDTPALAAWNLGPDAEPPPPG